MAEELSAEEAQKAISEEANDDDFKDAVEDEELAEGAFEVTKEELSIIRAELACEFPDDYAYLSDAYVLSVASKPYSKDPTVRRPLEVSEAERKPMLLNPREFRFVELLGVWSFVLTSFAQ